MDVSNTDGGPSGTPSVASSSSSTSISGVGHPNDQNPSTQSRENVHSSAQASSSSVPALLSPSSSQDPSGIKHPRPRRSPEEVHEIMTRALIVPPGANAYQHYKSVATRFEKGTLEAWTPHPLSPEEVALCRNVTEKHLDKIQQLEAAQMRLSRPATPVENALFLARLDYRVKFYRIFRINDLPMEILTNIFHLVAWSAPNPRAAVKARLWLTSTCRHWRTVAIQDPTLWNAVWFREPPDFRQAYTWFERAANSAIDIRINDNAEHPLTLESTAHLIGRLFEKLANIRVLIIVVQDWDPALFIIHALRQAAEKNLPMTMERFELHRAGSAYVQIGTGYEPSFYSETVPLFGGAIVPSFRYCALNGVHLDWDNSHLANLTTFDIRRMPLEKVPTVQRFRAILRDSPALSKMILDGAGPQWPQSMHGVADLTPIHLPVLKVLVMGDFSANYGAYILSQFSAPNVVDFTLMNLLGDDSAPFFNRLISSLPSVRTLTIHTAQVTSDETAIAIFKWLRSMPNLTYLRIINVHQSFLRLFLIDAKLMRPAVPGTQSLLCDKVAYLEFHSVDVNQVATWARIRRQLGSPLTKIYIGADTVSSLTTEQLSPLREVMRTPSGTSAVQILSHMQKPPEEEELLT